MFASSRPARALILVFGGLSVECSSVSCLQELALVSTACCLSGGTPGAESGWPLSQIEFSMNCPVCERSSLFHWQHKCVALANAQLFHKHLEHTVQIRKFVH